MLPSSPKLTKLLNYVVFKNRWNFKSAFQSTLRIPTCLIFSRALISKHIQVLKLSRAFLSIFVLIMNDLSHLTSFQKIEKVRNEDIGQKISSQSFCLHK